MGNLLLRNKNRGINTTQNDVCEKLDINKLIVLVDILRFENEKLKEDLDSKINTNNLLEEKLSKYITLSEKLEEMISIENEYWRVSDVKDYVKNDHDEFINFHYLTNKQENT